MIPSAPRESLILVDDPHDGAENKEVDDDRVGEKAEYPAEGEGDGEADACARSAAFDAERAQLGVIRRAVFRGRKDCEGTLSARGVEGESQILCRGKARVKGVRLSRGIRITSRGWSGTNERTKCE